MGDGEICDAKIRESFSHAFIGTTIVLLSYLIHSRLGRAATKNHCKLTLQVLFLTTITNFTWTKEVVV